MSKLAALFSTANWPAIGYWLIFFLGTCGWLLVCAGAAVRSKHNPLKSRMEYVYMNWDIFLVRQIPDLIIFTIWRYVTLKDIFAALHVPIGLPISGNGGLVAALCLGFSADALTAYALKSKYVPDAIRQWVQERIPELPADKPAGANPAPPTGT